MFNPFFDTSVLSEKELLKKIEEVSERMYRARLCGVAFEHIESMRVIIMSCEEELRCRGELKAMETSKEDDPCIFQSDMDYSKEAQNDSTRKQVNRPKW